MIKNIVIVLMGLLAFVLTYFSKEKNERKFGKSIICACLVSALGIVAPYIVEYFDDIEIEESVAQNDDEDEMVFDEEKPNFTNESDILEKESEEQEESQAETEQEDVQYITFMGESHTPTGVATNVSVTNWIENEDYDIAGQTYNGGLKITIFDMFSALDGNSSGITNEIISESHYALNAQAISNMPIEDQRFYGKFVIGKETDGSPSTAVISILLDGEEVYNSREVNCYSLDIPPFDVELSGKKEMVIKVACQHRGNPMIIGVVNNE